MTTLARLFAPFLEDLEGTERREQDLRHLFANLAELHHIPIAELGAFHVESVRDRIEAEGKDPLKTVRLCKRLVRFAARRGAETRWSEVEHVENRSKRRTHVPKAWTSVPSRVLIARIDTS